MKTVRRHNGWIVAAAAALSALACPITGAGAGDGRFEKLSVYLERNVQDHDAEIRFEATGAEDAASERTPLPGALGSSFLTRTGYLPGTPAYIAPELVKGRERTRGLEHRRQQRVSEGDAQGGEIDAEAGQEGAEGAGLRGFSQTYDGEIATGLEVELVEAVVEADGH